MATRRPGAGPPSLGVPPLRGGYPVDYGPRVDDRRQGLSSPPSRPSYNNSKEDHEDTPASRHLWVGNVSQDVSEAMIADRFGKFGEVDSVTVYSSRNYAFVNFRNQADAVEAKNQLQGVNIGGVAIRIEYAKGRIMKSEPARGRGTGYDDGKNMEEDVEARAKQSRHLWVGGISPSVSKEQIEGEFKKFGVLEDFKLLRERNCAFVDFINLEDAVVAVEALNRKHLGDDELRVDYGRSQPPKRDARGDERGSNGREHQGVGDGYRGPQHAYQGGGANHGEGRAKADKDGGPSEVLWVGFPLPSKVDEEALRRAFMPFGVVERVKTFPGRTYAFVEFQTVEDATRAKDSLEGNLFDDPRVHIRYSKSEIGPVENPRETSRINEGPPSQRMGDRQSYSTEMLGPRGVALPGSERLDSPGRASLTVNSRLGGLRPEYRPDTLLAGRGLDRGSVRSADSGPGMGRGSGRRLEEMDYSRVVPGNRPDSRLSFDDGWDLPDEEIVPRDSKRLRVYPGSGAEPPGFDPRYEQRQQRGSEGGTFIGAGRLDSYGNVRVPTNPDYIQGLGPRPRGALPSLSDGTRPLPVGTRPTIMGHGSAPNPVPAAPLYAKRDGENGKGPEGWQWHGTIAKGGTPVCRARCLPVGKGIDMTVPDVVNCTARTDLDMLAKHVYQAGDFGVVFFVPEGDPDVPPYQDFMHYLGEKHRAGVAKLADGTTLFLVPPSEFSEKVLKVPGQNCLFGVVLKFQQPVAAPIVNYISPQQQQPPTLSQQPTLFSQQQQPPPQHAPAPQPQYSQEHSTPSQQHTPPLQEPPVFQGSHQPLSSQGQQLQTGSGANGTLSTSSPSPILTQAQLASIAGLPGVLTPELIASLTALLPKTNTSPSSDTNSGPQLGSGGMKPFSANGSIPPGSTPIQGGLSGNPLQNDMRPMFRAPPQNNPPAGPPPGWGSTQQTQQDRQQQGMGVYHSQAPEQSQMYTSQPPTQQQQLPPLQQHQHQHQQLPPQHQHQQQQHQHLPQHPQQQLHQQHQQQQTSQMQLHPAPPSAPPAGQVPGFSGPTMHQQGYPGPSGASGQQFPPLPQVPRPPQQPMGGPQQSVGPPQQASGAPPQLPGDQLAQLTALLTQRQQQPAQQQAAAQLLQQHYSTSQPSSQSPNPQQGLVHQSQPPPVPQPPQGYAQQSQASNYSQFPQASWGQGPQQQLQTQQGGSQSAPMMPQQHQQQQAPSQMQGVNWEDMSSQTGVGTDQQGGLQTQGGSEPDAQHKRFQATVQLAAALLQQMQQQQGKATGGPEQR